MTYLILFSIDQFIEKAKESKVKEIAIARKNEVISKEHGFYDVYLIATFKAKRNEIVALKYKIGKYPFVVEEKVKENEEKVLNALRKEGFKLLDGYYSKELR